jgi:hypothetical protein
MLSAESCSEWRSRFENDCRKIPPHVVVSPCKTILGEADVVSPSVLVAMVALSSLVDSKTLKYGMA